MKRYLLYTVALWSVLALVGCNLKEDRIFDETPDERLSKSLAEYSEAMVSAPNGWLMQIATQGDGGYQLYVSFNESNRVTMLCDMDATFATSVAMSSVLRESSYKVKALQVPSLIFDTYNYIHQMADPKKEENGMPSNGTGLSSDYEFGIMNYDSRQFTLLGIYNKCMAYMRQATEAEAQAALNGGLKTVFTQLNTYLKTFKNPAIVIGDTKVGVVIGGRTITFSYMDAQSNEILSESAAMTMTLSSAIDSEVPVSDIVLFEPVSLCGKSITGFHWNGTALEAQTSDDAQGIVLYDNLVPVYPLLFGPEGTYQTLTFTMPDDYVGTVSQSYLDTYYTPAATLNSNRKIVYIKCQFTTNEQGLDVFRITAGSQTPPSTTTYVAIWDVTYVQNEDGTYTFSDREASGASGNASNARNYGQKMRGMLDIFSKVTYSAYTYSSSSNYNIVVDQVEPHTFRIDWLDNKTDGLVGPIGAFISTDDPSMYFCGKLE